MYILGLDPNAQGLGGRPHLVLRAPTGAAWVVVLALILAAGVVVLYRSERGGSLLRRTFAAVLRVAFLVLLLALLLRPTLRFNLEGTVRRALLFLVDDSASMKLADPRSDDADRKRAAIALGLIDPTRGLDQPLGTSQNLSVPRLDLLRSALRSEKLSIIPKLAKEYDLRPFVFAQSAAEVSSNAGNAKEQSKASWLDQLRGAGPATAMGDALRDALNRTRGQPLAGVVLITDGASNAGSAPAAAAEQAQQQGVPLYVWGVGIASPKDVIVANVFAQDVAFVDDELSVAVRVRSSGMEGRSGTLVLKLNDEQVAQQEVSFTGGEQLISLPFTPKKPGDFKLTASIAPADDEVVKDNNTQSQPLRVIDAKIKVLLVEQSPRWEFKYLMALLQRDRRIKLKVVLMEADPQVTSDPKSPYLPRFPTKREELFGYDLVILGDLDPRNLAAGQIEALHEFVSQLGGSLLMIAGHNFAPAAYRGTPVEKMLPVELDPQRSASSDAGTGDKPMRFELTPAGKQSMMMRLGDTEQASERIWSQLPPIFWDAPVLRAKPAAETLLVDAEPTHATRFGKMPLIALQQYGVGQVCYVGTDNTWRWRRNVGDQYHAALWGQMVQRLALPHLLGESKRTQLTADKRSYSTGERVTIFARLFTESYEPVKDAAVRGWYVSNAAGSSRQPVALRALPDQPGMYRGEFTAPAPGEYTFALERDEKTKLDLSVADPKLELGETAMNEVLLRQLATTSGGAFFREEDLFKLPDAIRLKTERVQSTMDVEIWSSPAYFIVMIGLLAAEWILRKTMQLK